MTAKTAIAEAEAILPGKVAGARETDPRWQAVIKVAQFIEHEPESVWPFILRWGSSPDSDLRMAIATCALEHLLEHHFDAFFDRVDRAAREDGWFADCVRSCWKFGESEEPTRALRLARLQESLGERSA
jgi:hypothetical protein